IGELGGSTSGHYTSTPCIRSLQLAGCRKHAAHNQPDRPCSQGRHCTHFRQSGRNILPQKERERKEENNSCFETAEQKGKPKSERERDIRKDPALDIPK